ncbi:hypothetical protein GCM10010398_36460 [Streptomyces fimbriatus]
MPRGRLLLAECGAEPVERSRSGNRAREGLAAPGDDPAPAAVDPAPDAGAALVPVLVRAVLGYAPAANAGLLAKRTGLARRACTTGRTRRAAADRGPARRPPGAGMTGGTVDTGRTRLETHVRPW